MNKQLNLVKDFHKKFDVLISEEPSLISKDRFQNRYDLMKEEVDEYLEGAQDGDIENIAEELADLLYALYGTIIEHGLQDKFDAIFKEVHQSHMSKDYHEYKMLKGPNYSEADIKKVLNSE